MNRKLFLFTCTLLLSFGLLAQDAPPALTYKKQFGFDGSVLVNRFLNFSGNAPRSSPYQVTLRKYGETSNIRYGLGLRLGSTFGNFETLTQSSVLFRIGKERFKQFGKVLPGHPKINRWRAFYGLDWKFQFSIFKNGASDDTDVSFAVGPSPFFGLSYQINERLSISTEMSYDFNLSHTRVSGNGVTRVTGEFEPPVALYLGYDF